MASVTCNQLERHSPMVNLLVYCKHCQSAICLSVTKQDTIDHDLNQFQRKQWKKHGQIMPKNWIDPFEIYD